MTGGAGTNRAHSGVGAWPWWLAAPLLAAWLLLHRPVADFDIFWQLRLGDMMLDSHGLVTLEPFAASHLGEPLVPLSAAAQVLLAALRRLGGWPLVQWLDAAVWTGGFTLAGIVAWRRGAEPIGLFVAMALALAMALPFSGVRPQSFAVLCFGALILLTGEAHKRSLVRTLGLGTALFVVWQNLHTSVSLAAAWCGARAATGGTLRLMGRREDWPVADAGLAVLATLAVFATPAGFCIIGVSALNARMSVLMGATEWLPLLGEANRPFLPILLVLNLCAAALLWLRRRTIRAEDMVAGLVLLALALGSGRFLLFWAVALVPLMAGAGPAPQPHRAGPWLLAGLVLLLLSALVTGAGGLAPMVPGPALDLVRAAGGEGPVYTSYSFGGVVIDALHPKKGVTFDGRYYRYTEQEWALVHAVQAGRVGAEALQQRYAPSAWLLDPGSDAALIADLRRHPERWREAGGDRASRVFVPTL